MPVTENIIQQAAILIASRLENSRAICCNATVDGEDATRLITLQLSTRRFAELLPDLLKIDAEKYSIELLQFKKCEWLSAISIEFKRKFHPTEAELTRLNKVLKRLLAVTSDYICKSKQEEFGSSMFFGSSAFSLLLSKLLSLVVATSGMGYVTPAVDFTTAFFGYILMHQLVTLKAPGMDEILKQPHLIMEKFIAEMNSYHDLTQLFKDLDQKVAQAEVKMMGLDSRGMLLYNAFICGLHVAAAGTVTKTFSDALQLVGTIASWCSRSVDSALGWIGLKSFASATTSWLSETASDMGLGSLANFMARFKFMHLSQVTTNAFLAELESPLGEPRRFSLNPSH